MAQREMGGARPYRERTEDEKGAPRRRPMFRRKVCRFCADKTLKIDYKDIRTISQFVTERGKMTPSRITGNCARHQRLLTTAIKRARSIALLPFTTANSSLFSQLLDMQRLELTVEFVLALASTIFLLLSGVVLPAAGVALIPFVPQPVLLFGLKYVTGLGMAVLAAALVALF